MLDFKFCLTFGVHFIREDSLLFINSIASVSLNDTDWRDYRGRFPELARKLVVEITEEEELDLAQLERKRAVVGASGIFALGGNLRRLCPEKSGKPRPFSGNTTETGHHTFFTVLDETETDKAEFMVY